MIVFFFFIFDEDANATVPAEAELEYNKELEFFFNDKVRKVWHKQQEEWYLSIVDIISVLTDSTDPKQYIKKMRSRDSELNSNWGTICTPVQMIAQDGKKRRINAANIAGTLRGAIAGNARKELENKLGKSVISPLNASNPKLLDNNEF